MTLKVFLDGFFSLIGLLLLAPFLIIVAVWIKFHDSGPAVFTQIRVGYHGKPFKLLKFRTMATDAESRGPMVTAYRDSRITPPGRVLRQYKIDEILQLVNVLLGQMSLVGPRPEVQRYVDHWSQEDTAIVLSLKPGITDLASFYYSNEQKILSEATDLEATYLYEVMPHKIRLYRKYVKHRSLFLDLRLILATILKLLGVEQSFLLPPEYFIY